jgi:RND family efflux transporter MFP subunit
VLVTEDGKRVDDLEPNAAMNLILDRLEWLYGRRSKRQIEYGAVLPVMCTAVAKNSITFKNGCWNHKIINAYADVYKRDWPVDSALGFGLSTTVMQAIKDEIPINQTIFITREAAMGETVTGRTARLQGFKTTGREPLQPFNPEIVGIVDRAKQAQITERGVLRDVTQAEREAAQAQLEKAAADVQVSSIRVDLSTAAYSARLNQLEASANSNGTITIAAPIDGVVSDREATIGASVEEAGKPLMTIINNDRVLASANIYEKDINKIRIGQPVQVKIAGQPSTTVFQGKVTVIGATVEGQSRIVPVKAEIGNVKGQLKAGMFTNIEILTDSVSVPILAIPAASVVEANGKQLVFVQNGKAYQPVDVTLGRTSGDLVEVTNGLFEGDRIVTQRANQLYAQSLRGDNKSKDDHSESVKPEVSAPNNWWLLLLAGGVGGGAMVAIAFWLLPSQYRIRH